MSLLSLTVFILCTLPYFGSAAKLPSFIVPCKRSDPEINKCLMSVAEVIQPHLGKGIPDLLVPPMNPLVLPRVTLTTPQGLNATFTNMKIFNVDNYRIQKLSMDLAGNRAEMKLTFPLLKIETDYAALGTILVLQLNAQGFSNGEYKNVVGGATVDFERHMKRGKEFLRIKKLDLKLDVGKPSLNFERLFGDDVQASQQANQLINNNIEAIIDIFRPVVYDVVGEILQGLVGRVFDKFSFDELFPN